MAVEQGTPLAEVLHAQEQDVRELGRRRLLEEGGSREIAMMAPVVSCSPFAQPECRFSGARRPPYSFAGRMGVADDGPGGY